MPISHKHTKLPQLDYVEEKNVEESYKMGQVKQNAYNENVTTLNKYYDSLAEYLPERPADRQYYKQELDKITRALTESVGNVDFSNINTIKSLVNVANPLLKDERFKNMTASDAEIQRRRAYIKELVTKNKGQFANQNYELFMSDVQEWMNDPEPGKKLEYKEYIPYYDMSKEFNERVKQMSPQIISDLQKVPGTAMLADIEIKTLAGGIIARNLQNTMSADAWKQLQIDVWAKTKNTPTEKKQAELTKYYTLLSKYSKEDVDKKAALEILKDIKNGDLSSYDNYYMSNYFTNLGETYQIQEVKTSYINDAAKLARLNTSLAVSLHEQKLQIDKRMGAGDFAPAKIKENKKEVPKIFNDVNTNNINLDKLNKGESILITDSNKSTLNQDILDAIKNINTTNATNIRLIKEDGKLMISYNQGTKEFKDDTGLYLTNDSSSSTTYEEISLIPNAPTVTNPFESQISNTPSNEPTQGYNNANVINFLRQ
jgi:hypothetical protein